jgi:hypothetical protein
LPVFGSTRPSINIRLNLGGIGLGILPWALNGLEARVPKVAFYLLLVIAVALIFVPWLLWGWSCLRHPRGDEIGEDGPALWAAQKKAKEERIRRLTKEEINR